MRYWPILLLLLGCAAQLIIPPLPSVTTSQQESVAVSSKAFVLVQQAPHTISWTWGQGPDTNQYNFLQAAPTLNGPWSNVLILNPELTNFMTDSSQQQQFFRFALINTNAL